MNQESLNSEELNDKEIIVKLKNSRLFGKNYSFHNRDLQTKNMSGLASLLFDEFKKHGEEVYDGKPIQVLLKLFFGGISKEKKIKDVESLNLTVQSKSKIIKYIEDTNILSEEKNYGFELGITRTVAIAAKYFKGKERELILDFINNLVNKKSIDKIKESLIRIDEQGINYFTPGIVSNLLFAYDPSNFYIWNRQVQNGLNKEFGINLSYKFSFKEYFEYLPIFKNIKETFNLKDYGQVDSVITGFELEGIDNSIRYWAGGFYWNNGRESHLDEFVKNGYWQIGWDKSEKRGKKFYDLIKQINKGDKFALKSYGGRNDLKIHKIGTVLDNSKKEDGYLKISWDDFNNLYHGKGPRGKGSGEWFGTLTEVTNKNAIQQVFSQHLGQESVQIFLVPASNETSQTNIKDSLNPGKEYSKLQNLLSEDGKEKLSSLDRIPSWGSVSSHKARWNSMKEGDWVLFYVKGSFTYAGKVKHKEQNSKLSRELWGENDRGNLWELMFFLEKLFDINIDIDTIRKYSDYKSNWILQGFTKLKDSALDKIKNDYNSIEDFLGLNGGVIIPKDKDIVKSYSSFFEFLEKKGFIFNSDLVESYLISLKVKPFIILTGNSGTGKTKIAQLFAEYLDQSKLKQKSNDIESIVTVGKSLESGGWSFKREDFFNRYPNLKQYEGYFPITVNGLDSHGRLVITPRLFFDREDDKLKDMLRELSKNSKDKKIILKISTNENIENCYSVIPVGANWTENRHIVGFHNVITDQYQGTNSLNLILKSIRNPSLPHFLILDEMNLSHVERYFADFLSAMESNEPIPLHNNDLIEDIPNQITIPENLFVIGTVNIDETTYMFSPKVLDRANTIEFNTFPAKKYLTEEISISKPEGNISYLENLLEDTDIRYWDINKIREQLKNVKISNNEFLWDILSEEINKFQVCLKKAGFDFGFRVINEILRYMYVAWKYENQKNPWNNWEKYFDAQIKQKMLPKLHGSQRSLIGLFKELKNLCLYEKNEKEARNINDIENIARFKTSALKIKEMDKTLFEQRYVSFTR